MDAIFELEIGAGSVDGTFIVHVLRSLAGGDPTATITLDIDDIIDGLPAIESSILASSVSARRVMTSHESAIQEIGVRLFDAVFAGRVGESYRSSVAVAAERGLVARLTLRLTAPHLAALPWEALYDSDAGRYISRKEPLVRRVPSPGSSDSPPVAPPLRILGMVASPRGLQTLDVDAEKERLESALQEHLQQGQVELAWLEDASWSGLHNMLLREPWHVLHFVGHGGYDVAADEGLIALVGPDGRADFVSASSFADLLNEATPTPRLVVLNSCQSGSSGPSDLFSGTASTLVRSGIRSVVAMQFAVSDVAALAFARSFYVALASGRRIDEAVRSGRIGILGIARDTLEWITPVLYLQGDDAHLLDPVAASARTPSVTAPPPSVSSAPVAVDPPPPPADPPPTRARRRGTLMRAAVAVAAAVILGGIVWAAIALIPPPPDDRDADETRSPMPTSTTLPPVAVEVLAATPWTVTGVICEEGDVLDISATGTILHAPITTATVSPDGLEDPAFHQFNVPGLPDSATAGMIGSLDQEQPFFFVGSALQYTCPSDGELSLGINDVGLDGNSGWWQATVIRTDNP